MRGISLQKFENSAFPLKDKILLNFSLFNSKYNFPMTR